MAAVSFTRAVLVLAALVVVAFVVAVAVATGAGATPLIVIATLAALVGGGNLLYGRNSHFAKAQARVRPAQQARNRAIDEARRAAAEQPAADRPSGRPEGT